MNWEDMSADTANSCINDADEPDFFLNSIDHIFSPGIADLVPPEMNGLTFGQVAMGYVMLVYKDGTGRKATKRLEHLRESSTESGMSSVSEGSASFDSIDSSACSENPPPNNTPSPLATRGARRLTHRTLLP